MIMHKGIIFHMHNQLMPKWSHLLSPCTLIKSAQFGLKIDVGVILHAESADAKIDLFTQPMKTAQICPFWPENAI